ncbi:MAG: selenide, water dikinase SelD, partial [Planctomycetota bacterium]
VPRAPTGAPAARPPAGPKPLPAAGDVLLGDAPGLPALVQTVDFFPPVVDDPALYGAIAAANSLSDVYAMGGRPWSALALASFPADFDPAWRAEILKSGYAKVREAGAVVAGGHTVEGEVQFGFAVTGLIEPERVASNAGAQAGDVAYLTKPLGMGCMTTAAKLGKIEFEALRPAAEQMATLNDRAAEAMNAVGASACTDITGFGLIGHAMNIARASELTLRFDLARIPLFPGALELAKKGLFSGGAQRGRVALGDDVQIADGLDPAQVSLLFDAETSGGLLIVLPAERAEALERELRARELPIERVGEVVERAERTIELR